MKDHLLAPNVFTKLISFVSSYTQTKYQTIRVTSLVHGPLIIVPGGNIVLSHLRLEYSSGIDVEEVPELSSAPDKNEASNCGSNWRGAS